MLKAWRFWLGMGKVVKRRHDYGYTNNKGETSIHICETARKMSERNGEREAEKKGMEL